MSEIREPSLHILLDPEHTPESLVADVRRGLGTTPRMLPPKWLYDERGAQLFDEITRLPEYYPTAREREILTARAADIAERTAATTLVELGSGTSDKTRLLLDALRQAGTLERFVPVDVSVETLQAAAEQLSRTYPGLAVTAVVGDFTLHLGDLPRGGRRLLAFLGGTIGNLYLEERAAFLGAVYDSLAPGDCLLLGTDLVKDPHRLITAYDDPAGITEAFVKNALHVLNRTVGADFDVECFSYVPFWDSRLERMDLRLRADMPQRVRLPGAGLTIDLTAGEEIRIEISTKFRTGGIRRELESAGFRVDRQYLDHAGDFAVTLACR